MNEQLLKANGKKARFQGSFYRIIANQLGGKIRCQAEPLTGGQPIDLLKTRSTLGKALRTQVSLGLCS